MTQVGASASLQSGGVWFNRVTMVGAFGLNFDAKVTLGLHCCFAKSSNFSLHAI